MTKTMYYIKQTEPQLWTVGYGDGNDWTPHADYDSKQDAEDALYYLNGHKPKESINYTITLRDHFAGLAMQGWLSFYQNPTHRKPSHETIAAYAYEIADAMLKERDR